MSCDVIIGVDAGTSVIKAVAFDLSGKQIASSAHRNLFHRGPDGAVTQSRHGHGPIASQHSAGSRTRSTGWPPARQRSL